MSTFNKEYEIIQLKINLEEAQRIIKNLELLNKKHYNLYIETEKKLDILKDELLIFHAEVRGHKSNWEDMFYSDAEIGYDMNLNLNINSQNIKERKRSHSI
jgi:hypothetical protein